MGLTGSTLLKVAAPTTSIEGWTMAESDVLTERVSATTVVLWISEMSGSWEADIIEQSFRFLSLQCHKKMAGRFFPSRAPGGVVHSK